MCYPISALLVAQSVCSLTATIISSPLLYVPIVIAPVDLVIVLTAIKNSLRGVKGPPATATSTGNVSSARGYIV